NIGRIAAANPDIAAVRLASRRLQIGDRHAATRTVRPPLQPLVRGIVGPLLISCFWFGLAARYLRISGYRLGGGLGRRSPATCGIRELLLYSCLLQPLTSQFVKVKPQLQAVHSVLHLARDTALIPGVNQQTAMEASFAFNDPTNGDLSRPDSRKPACYFCSPLGEDGEVDMRSAHCFTSATGNSTRLWLPCIDSLPASCASGASRSSLVPEDMVAVAAAATYSRLSTPGPAIQDLSQPCAPNIGFAIGAFELETGPPLSGATRLLFLSASACLSDEAYSLPACLTVLAFYESLLGVRLPYGSLKLVPYASVILASVSLLHSARIVDQAIESRRALALALAQQFFVGLLHRHADIQRRLATQGISASHSALYQRKVFGHNEYQTTYRDQMSQDTVPPDYAAIYRSKAMLVIRLLGLQAGEEVLQYVLNKLITLASSYDPSLQQQPLQPGTEQSWRPAFLLSSQALLDLILALTGKNMQYLLDQASFSINKKRNLIALEIRDDPPVAASGGGGGAAARRRRYTGAVAVSLQELDGPFTHTLKLGRIGSRQRPALRKIKRRKVLLSNGDELEDPDLGKLESDCSLLWLRVDPENAAYRHVEIVAAPEPMWHLLPALRDDALPARMAALQGPLCQPCFHSRGDLAGADGGGSETSASISQSACRPATLCVHDQRPLDLLEPLMAVFLSLFGAKDTRGASVHVAAATQPRASARLRCPNSFSICCGSTTNSKNIYADDYYRAALIESLFRTSCSHCYYENFLAKLPKPIAALLEGAHRLHPADIGIFKSYAAPGNYIDVRLAAMEAVDAAALAWLLDSTVCNPAEEASVRHQAVAMLTIQPPFLRRKRGQLDTPELVERLWRLLNTELSGDCRLAAPLPALYHLLYGRHRPKYELGAPRVRKQRGGVAAHFANPWRPRAASAAVSRREFRWCRRPQRGPPPESPGGAPRCRRENFLVLNVREGRTKIAQRAPTPTPAPADTDDDNANFGLTGAGVGLGSSGDEADVDDDLDIGLEDDYEPGKLGRAKYVTCPTMSSELQSSHWYQFWHSIDCNSTARWEPLREPSFLAFLCAADAAQCLLCLLSLLLNSLSYLALGRDGSDSTLAMQLRSLAVTDVIYVLANTIDNFCHTLETLPARLGTPPVPAADFRPPHCLGGIRVAFITLHNWLMLFMAAVRFAKIRWPLRANL
uniref:SET domain-containing protein n=1 Tax=Macrostomum lignano TaxID=282301 RepID=A0A1I8JS08_9PLAT